MKPDYDKAVLPEYKTRRGKRKEDVYGKRKQKKRDRASKLPR